MKMNTNYELNTQVHKKDRSLPIYLQSYYVKNFVFNTLDKQKPIVFSGSFDPWTYGHEAVVRDYLKIYPNGRIKIIIAKNPKKSGTFSPEERKILIKKSIGNDIVDNVDIEFYEGLVPDLVYENGYAGVLKGSRTSVDFDYEKDIASASKAFSGDMMTIIMPQTDTYKSGVSSSSLKALSNFGGKTYKYATPIIREALRMKQKNTLLIGLTGGIGAGKSTLGKGLEGLSKNKDIEINYLNLDKITHDIHTKSDIAIYQKIRDKIAEKFGNHILNFDGTTNKKVLGKIVFNDSSKMEELMDILLEPLIHFLRKEVDFIYKKNDKEKIILVEGAIIFDRKLTYIFDENIVNISVDKDKQIERIKQRDGFNEEQVNHRLSSQLSRVDRLEGIKKIQGGFADRLLIDIDGANYNSEDIYNKLEEEFYFRKNMFR